MIDYETYCRIVQLHQKQLKPTQIARNLSLDLRTVLHWIKAGSFRPRRAPRRASKLEPFKPYIKRWLETYSYTGVQVLQRLREMGYDGGSTILDDYIRTVRPPKSEAYLTLSFEPGESAQVDWGQYGSVSAGSTRRRLSFFVMVLCHSRMMYVEFTLLQSMEHFLGCHQNAFNFFGAVPRSIMVDNLKSAVIRRMIGEAPVFNPRYLDFANHHGFSIRACGVARGNEKGRVENGVGYVKKNFLGGLEIADFSAVNPAARHWLETIANLRMHGATRKQPVELFKVEKPAMLPLPDAPYDVGVCRRARATNQFRVILDTNRYSVPAEYAGQRLETKAYPDKIHFYHNDKLIARHPRSYDRNRDFEDPDHPKALLAQRRAAREQRLLMRFLTLSPKAEVYYQQLCQRRMNPRHHIRQIVALSEIYAQEKIQRAIEDAFTFQAFSCEYIANILEQRARLLPEPSALHLTRREDLLDLDMPEANLAIYEARTEQKGSDENDRKENN